MSSCNLPLRNQISINTGVDCRGSWPCSHSSLRDSQDLLNIEKWPFLYSMQHPSLNKQPLSFVKKKKRKKRLQAPVWTVSMPAALKMRHSLHFITVYFFFLYRGHQVLFDFTSDLQGWHVGADLIRSRVAFQAACCPFYGHVFVWLLLIGPFGKLGLDRCLEEGHLFGHVLI